MERAIEWGAGASVPYTVLMVVTDPGGPTPGAADRKALMESWGYTVNLIDDNDSQANFDAGIAAADVVYVGSGSVASNIGTKLDATTKGVVNEPGSMASTLGFASSLSVAVGVDQLTIVDSTHSITQGFASPVTVFTSLESPAALSGTLSPDLQNLAEFVGTPALAVLESGAAKHDSGTTAGRRAQLPFASAGSGELTADGQLIVRRAIEWAAGSGGPPPPPPCDGTFRDEFNAQVWSGSDGTLAWATNWLEWGEGGTPTGGDIMVMDDMGPYAARVRDNGTSSNGAGIRREADLSAYTTATLSFDYRRDGPDNANDYVTVDVSNDGGGSWTELDRFIGEGNNTEDPSYVSTSYDISAYMSVNTRIRFLSSPDFGNQDVVYFDNVEICVNN
jgi:hypothetical protein